MEKRNLKSELYRLLTIFSLIAIGVSACTPAINAIQTPSILPPSSTPTPVDMTQISPFFKPPSEASILSLLTRISPEIQGPGLSLIEDPIQRETVARVLYENSIAAAGGRAVMAQEAIRQKVAVGIGGCVDTRTCIDFQMPSLIDGKPMISLEVSKVAGQPSIFPTELSLFTTHRVCAPGAGIPLTDVNTGCGGLGAVLEILKKPGGVGEVELKGHGITQLTIDELHRLINMGSKGDPMEWARVGAQIQAQINLKANGKNHFVGWGVRGHADGSFVFAEEVIDAFGNRYKLNDPRFNLLKEWAEFLHKPHPLLAEAAKDQAPVVNIVNLSRKHTPQVLVGDMTMESGTVFRSTVDLTPGIPVSAREAEQAFGAVDYSLTHLKQRGGGAGVLLLIADNEKDLTTGRTTFLTKGLRDGSAEYFFENDGLLVELMPNTHGKFSGSMGVRNAKEVGRDLAITKRLLSADVRIDQGLLAQATEIVKSEVKVGRLTATQAKKINSIINALRPLGTLAKWGLRVVGDATTIIDFAEFFQKTLLREDLVYTTSVRFNSNKIRYITPDENTQFQYRFGQANPYISLGMTDDATLTYESLIKEHASAVRAFFKYGKGMPQARPPWNTITTDDLAKTIRIVIPAMGTQSQTTITTFLSILPERSASGSIVFNESDPGQMMQLVDAATGMVILGSESGQPPRLIVGFDEKNPSVRYFFQVTADPMTRQFRISFVNAVDITKLRK